MPAWKRAVSIFKNARRRLNEKVDPLEETTRHGLAIGIASVSAIVLAIVVLRPDGSILLLVPGALFLFAVAMEVARPRTRPAPAHFEEG